ncbi:hypothetical protein GCM10027061_27180 [Nesterenkonia suensis]
MVAAERVLKMRTDQSHASTRTGDVGAFSGMGPVYGAELGERASWAQVAGSERTAERSRPRVGSVEGTLLPDTEPAESLAP